MFYNDPNFNSYAEYYAYAMSRGNTPLAEDTIAYFVQQARANGITDARMTELLSTNPADWGRFNTAFTDVEGAYSQGAITSQGGVQVLASSLPPPSITMPTSGADQRMFLTLQGVPTSAGGGTPARQLAPIVASGAPSFGSSLFSTSSSTGGFDLMKLLVMAALGYAAWHFLKKG